jgi:DeoR/GlpR family transcriptional regulator of sugar metabolism
MMNDSAGWESDRARREWVLRLLRDQTTASISEIAAKCRVSQMTSRRDIQKLVESRQVIRVPGGARIGRTFGTEKDFLERLQRMSQAKSAIGQAAASLVEDGESIALDSGTTTLHIARHVRSRRNLVVFTYSLTVLEELAAAESVRVELTGGVYRPSSHDLVGRAVEVALAGVCADRVFVGAASVSFHKGVMVYDQDAQYGILHAGKQKILVVDSSKIGIEARYQFCPVEACDLIITDSGISPQNLERLQKLTKVMVARDSGE